MALNLERFISEEHFILCPLMTADDFIRLCGDCDLGMGRADLEMLERAGLFYPLVRVQFPEYIEKIRRVDNGYQILGPLREGESWDGETQKAYGSFYFKKNIVEGFYQEGLLWRPQDRPFEPWKKFWNETGGKLIENYYSPFQIYYLWNLWQTTLFRLSLLSWASLDQETIHKTASELASWGKELKKVWSGGSRFTEAAEICIAIANRYFPETQTDRRVITVPAPIQYHNWDWYEYCRQWTPCRELLKLNIDTEKLRHLQKTLASDAQYVDPLAKWYSLVQFISLEHKRRLKGKALLAQWLYAMEMMLRLFHEEITGDRLPAPDDDYHRWKEHYYGQGVPERELEFLEYLTNHFHLNPRPKLILVIEGEGEFDQLPRIAEDMGYPFERVGIRVELLHGIAEFTGGKKERKSGGRLTRFIDYHHQLQTLVYVILDNEGGSHKVKTQLVRARSRYPESRRSITKEEHVFIWERNFEFDNFTDVQIASALSNLAAKPNLFQEEEVENCRRNFGKPGFQLEKLFQSKTRRELTKRELVKLLVDRLLERTRNQEKFDLPKIVKKLEEIIQIAVKNYQPTGRETWLRNQESGFLAPVAK